MNPWGLLILLVAIFVTLVGLVSSIITIHTFVESHQKPTIKQRPVTISIAFIVAMFLLAVILLPISFAVGKASTPGPSPTPTGQKPTATIIQVTPTPTFTQSAPIDLTPDSVSYGHKINSWSKPAYNGYCQLPDCDPTSKRVDMLTEGTVVTATCWTYGQMVITGTLTDPGYKDIRWIKLEDGSYLPNTWFLRDRLSPQLSRC
jgi:hypothetical protein